MRAGLLLRSSVVFVLLGCALTGSAQAPAVPATYVAQPPTQGALYRDGQSGRYLLGGAWLYRADPGDQGMAQGWWRDFPGTGGWSPVTVPNAYNAGDFSHASMAGSVGWYRRDFMLPSAAFARYVPTSDRGWIIRFESVNYRATVWLNGHQLGTHAGAYLPFELDLNQLRPGVNRLIVRVDDRRSPSDLPSGPGGGWWNYGGLLREVYLRAVQRADIASVQVRPLLPCPTCAATITEQASVRNVTPRPQTVSLSGTYGGVPIYLGAATIPAHGTWRATGSVLIAHPHLWFPYRPTLYHAVLTLSAHGQTLAGYVTDSGIRSIAVMHGRLELNGRLLNLRGVDLHEQNVQTGAALDPAQLGRMVGWVKAVGATLIRSHYPLNPQILEMADREGILVWSEIPVWRVSSQYLAEPGVVAQAHAMLRTSILTNQNHPSVLVWSVANELTTPANAVEGRYIAGAAALVHRLDPTRPAAMAISDWPGVACQRAYASLDVLGFNDYFGWFGAGGGATDDRDQLGPFLDNFRACYPAKALFVSEFGFDGSRHGPVEERGTYEFQADSAAFHLRVFAIKPWLSGAIYWLLQDFAAYPGATGGNPQPSPPFVQKGLYDLFGNPKPAFSTVAAIFKATIQVARP